MSSSLGKVLWWYFSDTSGRANVAQMWASMVFYFFMIMVAALILALLPKGASLEPIFLFVALIPAFWFKLFMGIKRCHDLGHSGFLLLLGFVPVANFYLLALYFVPGDKEPNKYGSKPKWFAMPKAITEPEIARESVSEII